MKYKAVELTNGNFAVGYGKKFYPSTETADKEKAEERAMIMSLQYHYEQAQKIFDQLEKRWPEQFDGNSMSKTNFGDLIC